MRRVAIERLRITGLAGRAPTRAEVEVALRSALAAADPAASADPPRRIEGGRTLAEAGAALGRALGAGTGTRR